MQYWNNIVLIRLVWKLFHSRFETVFSFWIYRILMFMRFRRFAVVWIANKTFLSNILQDKARQLFPKDTEINHQAVLKKLQEIIAVRGKKVRLFGSIEFSPVWIQEHIYFMLVLLCCTYSHLYPNNWIRLAYPILRPWNFDAMFLSVISFKWIIMFIFDQCW